MIVVSYFDTASKEVLPSIRKQGGYLVTKNGETELEIMTRAMDIVKATLAKRDEQIAKLQPRADYARLGLAR